MKRCPTCNRTYEDDALSFCPSDGSSLARDEPAAPASFDPQATILAPPPANTYTPPAYSSDPPPPSNDWGAQGGGYPASPPPSSPPSAWSGGSAPQQQQQGWGGGYQQQMPPPPPYGMAQTKQTGMAVASLICGILSFLCFSILTGIPAIILGAIALNKEKQDPAHYGGKGMAIGGIALGALSVLILIFYVIIIAAGGLR
jgi:hypothetical protein